MDASFICGLILGSTFGFLVFSLCFTAKESDKAIASEMPE